MVLPHKQQSNWSLPSIISKIFICQYDLKRAPNIERRLKSVSVQLCVDAVISDHWKWYLIIDNFPPGLIWISSCIMTAWMSLFPTSFFHHSFDWSLQFIASNYSLWFQTLSVTFMILSIEAAHWSFKSNHFKGSPRSCSRGCIPHPKSLSLLPDKTHFFPWGPLSLSSAQGTNLPILPHYEGKP